MRPAVYRSLMARRCAMVGLEETSLHSLLPLIHQTGVAGGRVGIKFRTRYEPETPTARVVVVQRSVTG